MARTALHRIDVRGLGFAGGAWKFPDIRRREARSRNFDPQAQGVIVGSEIGGAYSDTSPLMDLTVRFTDHNGAERQVGVQKVVPLNELPLHGLASRYSCASPPPPPPPSW